MNVHFHSLFFDGVFVRGDDGTLEFHEFDEPSPEQVVDVAARTAKRVINLLEKAGKSLDAEFQDDEADEFVMRQPALASLYAAAARGVDISGDHAGQPTMRLIQQDSVEKKEPHAVVAGIHLHAGVAFDARDRPRMERMCRYLASSPIAQHRLTRRSDGSIQYAMKKHWRDGTHAIVLQPLDLIARLCVMIPPPRFNMIRFHGVLPRMPSCVPRWFRRRSLANSRNTQLLLWVFYGFRLSRSQAPSIGRIETKLPTT